MAAEKTSLPVPYRSDERDVLIRELREQIAQLTDPEFMHPFSGTDISVSCIKCGVATRNSPSWHYEPAVPPINRWWRKRPGRPERMRRECNQCGAVYFEHVASTGEAR